MIKIDTTFQIRIRGLNRAPGEDRVRRSIDNVRNDNSFGIARGVLIFALFNSIDNPCSPRGFLRPCEGNRENSGIVHEGLCRDIEGLVRKRNDL